MIRFDNLKNKLQVTEIGYSLVLRINYRRKFVVMGLNSQNIDWWQVEDKNHYKNGMVFVEVEVDFFQQ